MMVGKPRPPVAAPGVDSDHRVAARHLIRACGTAALATYHRQPDGWPFPALVLVATDHDGAPLLLISRLAEHTQNLLVDSRAGLLFDGTQGHDPVLAGPRLSVVGHAVPSTAPRHRARFLARHPEAAQYAGFGDFALWRLAVERAHFVGGFGRIRWIEGRDLLLPEQLAAGFEAGEAQVSSHMNKEHSEIVGDCASGLPGSSAAGPGGGGWLLTGLDPDGADLRRGGEVCRLPFDAPAATADEAAGELVRRAETIRTKRTAG